MTSNTPRCCRTSVGVIIERAGSYLLFDRAKFPVGVAPVAGHALDEHVTYENAAYAEVREEVGLEVVDLTLVWANFAANRCRRQLHEENPGHEWRVYWAEVRGDLEPSAEETRNARWVSLEELQQLALRTVWYAQGFITEGQYNARPGLEPIWVEWFHHLGHVSLGSEDQSAERLEAVQELYGREPGPCAKPRVRLTEDDALNFWNALTIDEKRALFTRVWETVQPVRESGDVEPFVRFTESLGMSVHMVKIDPSVRQLVRESEARGPVPADQLVPVETVIAMLRDGGATDAGSGQP